LFVWMLNEKEEVRSTWPEVHLQHGD
jgi:hypothetical protein